MKHGCWPRWFRSADISGLSDSTPETRDGLDAGLEALRATPPARLHAELALAAAHRSALRVLPSRLAALAEGRRGATRRLVGAPSYHRGRGRAVLAAVQARVEADRAVRGRALLMAVRRKLLGSLPPVLRWLPRC